MDYMTCSRYFNSACTDGSCPASLYDEYGAAFGYYPVSCYECSLDEGFCESCFFQVSELCPLDYVHAEAVPFYREE